MVRRKTHNWTLLENHKAFASFRMMILIVWIFSRGSQRKLEIKRASAILCKVNGPTSEIEYRTTKNSEMTHQVLFADRDYTSLTHCNMMHKNLVPWVATFPAQRAAVQKEWNTLRMTSFSVQKVTGYERSLARPRTQNIRDYTELEC